METETTLIKIIKYNVIPAKAGIQTKIMDPLLRGDDNSVVL